MILGVSGYWLNSWVLVELTSPACLLFSFKVVEDTLSCAEEGVSLAKRRTFFARVGTQLRRERCL